MSGSSSEAVTGKVEKVDKPIKPESAINFTPASDAPVPYLSEPLTEAEVEAIKGDALTGRFVTCERGDRLIVEAGFLAVQQLESVDLKASSSTRADVNAGLGPLHCVHTHTVG